jgi:alkanesulfonate monooxygenase SsuD/methylene tetrahydromethanopterin reductase-like flavin-dependent oxidoreductase (luciferase family)
MFVAKFCDGVVPAPHPEKGQAEVAELGALVDAKVRARGRRARVCVRACARACVRVM